jgi:hypothetical protein
MGNEVAKITVGIEAKVDELAADMKRAEQVVKSGTNNIEKSVETASKKIEKSWTEGFSKLSVIQLVAQTALQVFTAIEGVVMAIGDEGLNMSQKITASLDAVEQAGIPVVSQMLAIGRGLYNIISGEARLTAEIKRQTAVQQQRYDKAMLLYSIRNDISETYEGELKLLQDAAELQKAGSDAERVRIRARRELEAMEIDFIEKIKVLERGRTTERMEQEKAVMQGIYDEKVAQFNAELELAEQRDAQLLASKQRLYDAEVAAANAAEEKKIRDEQTAADKLKDLQSQLRVAELEADGKTLDAQLEQKRRFFEKLKSQATGESLEILKELERLEIASIRKKAKEGAKVGVEEIEKEVKTLEIAGAGGKGGTTSVGTAIGSFTVASGSSPALSEARHQTDLLVAIAENTSPLKNAKAGEMVAAT